MFRLISLLIVILIMGAMAAIMMDSMTGSTADCPARADGTGPTTTLPEVLVKGVPGLAGRCV